MSTPAAQPLLLGPVRVRASAVAAAGAWRGGRDRHAARGSRRAARPAANALAAHRRARARWPTAARRGPASCCAPVASVRCLGAVAELPGTEEEAARPGHALTLRTGPPPSRRSCRVAELAAPAVSRWRPCSGPRGRTHGTLLCNPGTRRRAGLWVRRTTVEGDWVPCSLAVSSLARGGRRRRRCNRRGGRIVTSAGKPRRQGPGAQQRTSRTSKLRPSTPAACLAA